MYLMMGISIGPILISTSHGLSIIWKMGMNTKNLNKIAITGMVYVIY